MAMTESEYLAQLAKLSEELKSAKQVLREARSRTERLETAYNKLAREYIVHIQKGLNHET